MISIKRTTFILTAITLVVTYINYRSYSNDQTGETSESLHYLSAQDNEEELAKEVLLPQVEILDLEKRETQTRLPVKATLYAFEQSLDQQVLVDFLASIKAENNELREIWVKEMPTPKNSVQELLLYALSTKKFKSEILGNYNEIINPIGTSLDQLPQYELTEFVKEILERGRINSDDDIMMAVYKYNADHLVDYDIGDEFINDIQLALEDKLPLTDPQFEETFSILLKDPQFTAKEKLALGNKILEKVSDQNIINSIKYNLEKDILPLI